MHTISISTQNKYLQNVKKIIRFIHLYGLKRTIFKVIGRNRLLGKYIRPRLSKVNRDIGVIGCGQYTFSTVGHVLCGTYGNRFVDCFDIDENAMSTFSKFYRISPSISAEKLIKNKEVLYVYIASNHATHSDYAINALLEDKNVYLEKPISVTYEQLKKLYQTTADTDAQIYAGYNRPFSKAILDLKKHIGTRKSPISMNCFITGHMLAHDHWYRNLGEGTRICGNVGHWLDLAVHILSWGELPDMLEIQVSYSNKSVRDEDISITITSDYGDLIVIVLTARCEPFEGINETINLQCNTTIAKIDDFRTMTIWDEETLLKKRYGKKDVGHNSALKQPFLNTITRDWNEVLHSTLLMLYIADMVKTNRNQANFSFKEQFLKIS